MGKVYFGDVVNRIDGNEDRLETSRLYYVGGEHYDSESLEIPRFGLIKEKDLGYQFHYPFEVGDVLFMTKNPHLKKAGRVNFQGICSIASFVLRSADETVLLQEYLPIIMQSDDLWNYLEANKSGSVNYFITWKTLSKYEFDLPSIEKQKSIANVLWAIHEAKKANQELITQTQELARAEFSNMISTTKTGTIVKLGSVLTQYKKTEKIIDTKSEKYISVPLYGKGIVERDVSAEEIKPFSGVRIKSGQFVYSRIWVWKGASGIVPESLNGSVVTNEFPTFDIDRERINETFLLYLTQDETFLNELSGNRLGSTTKQRVKESTFIGTSITLPSMEEQIHFESIARKVDENIQALNIANENLDAMMKSLINQSSNEEVE